MPTSHHCGTTKDRVFSKSGSSCQESHVRTTVPTISKLSKAIPDCTLVMEGVSYSRITHAYDLPSAKEWIWKDTSAYELSFCNKRVVLTNHQVTGAYDPPTEKKGVWQITSALFGFPRAVLMGEKLTWQPEGMQATKTALWPVPQQDTDNQAYKRLLVLHPIMRVWREELLQINTYSEHVLLA